MWAAFFSISLNSPCVKSYHKWVWFLNGDSLTKTSSRHRMVCEAKKQEIKRSFVGKKILILNFMQCCKRIWGKQKDKKKFLFWGKEPFLQTPCVGTEWNCYHLLSFLWYRLFGAMNMFKPFLKLRFHNTALTRRRRCLVSSPDSQTPSIPFFAKMVEKPQRVKPACGSSWFCLMWLGSYSEVTSSLSKQKYSRY